MVPVKFNYIIIIKNIINKTTLYNICQQYE